MERLKKHSDKVSQELETTKNQIWAKDKALEVNSFASNIRKARQIMESNGSNSNISHDPE